MLSVVVVLVVELEELLSVVVVLVVELVVELGELVVVLVVDGQGSEAQLSPG